MAPTQNQSKLSRTKVIAGGKQPKARIQRYLKKQESQLVEGARAGLLLKGIKCSNSMSTILKDMRSMKAPNAKLLTKNNMILPFEDAGQQSLEFLTTKNDCSLFAMASHNKKRPNNLIMGRTFDRHILDMVELGVTRYKSLADYSGGPKKRIGSKPLMLFCGDKWHLEGEFKRLQNMLIDFYKGDPVDKFVLSGMDHMMVFTVAEPTAGAVTEKPTVHQRTYFCKLKKNPNGEKVPIPYLVNSGPDMDFKIRRTQFASKEMWNLALKQPAGVKAKKTKNHTTNIFGETIGRLHLDKQDVDKMQGKKSKSLRIAGKIEADEEKAALDAELNKEKDGMGMEFKQTYGFDEQEAEKGSKRRGGKKN